jgi:3-deoxy-D-manno-octulosonic-acid transferase
VMRFLYTFFIHAYGRALSLASLFNHKAALWIEGRKNILSKIEETLKPNEKCIWFHCASLGEFEQGRPLIERIKKEKPEFKIFVTFFSPSGYEIRKNYPFADYIFYLPADTPSNTKRFLNLVKPEMVVFVKYEFWFNYFRQIKLREIPLYLMGGVLPQDIPYNPHTRLVFPGWCRLKLPRQSSVLCLQWHL